MCGRYVFYEVKDLGKRYNLAIQPRFVSEDNYNVSPGQRLPVVYQEGDKRMAELMQWGFLPFFAKDPAKSFRPINTVSETVFEKPMWREAIKHHRALIPARGFYEWKKFLNANGKVEHRVPYFIHPKHLDLFSFAGVYSVWKDVEGYPLYTFSIMTTVSNKEMEMVHDRMPVILRPEQESFWLEPSYSEQDQLAKLLVPYEDGGLDIYKVSEDVNSAAHNDKHLIDSAS